MVKRVENWPLLLSEFLTEKKNQPFEWGVHDCLQFVARGVERLTGVDFYKDYPSYNTKEAAAEMLAENKGVAGIINACLGTGSRHVLKAKRGDVVVAKMPELTAGLVDDTGRYIIMLTEAGWQKFPLQVAWKFWSY